MHVLKPPKACHINKINNNKCKFKMIIRIKNKAYWQIYSTLIKTN